MNFFKKTLPSMLTDGYKALSVKSLSLAVSPTVMGDVPKLAQQSLTFYVLDEYSRANSLLLEQQLQKAGLPSALTSVEAFGVSESSAMIFLKHRHAKTAISPRLERLIQACIANPKLEIRLVPVTILWGRAPDKEKSLFKLLVADEWRVPSISKQLFNIGVMGRDTFVRFYDAKNLQTLIADAKNTDPDAITPAIAKRLKGYLLKQRTSILGPDLSDKRNITNSILNAPVVQDAITATATATGKSVHAIKKEARGYIDEIASDYSYSVVRVFERFLDWLWTQLYDGVQVEHFDRVKQLAPDYQIIYVPCHRSHMDYLLLSYAIHTHGLRIPHVAAGANLNIPVVGEILRAGGAFFLRRSFRDNPLYGTVFKEYLHNLMLRSAPIEYFIEGGRSRTGRLLTPKLGMLAMTVASHFKSPAKPVVFIPTYISYERIMEGATYVGELKGKPKESENLLQILKTAQKIERIFGTVHLSFGEPLFLEQFIHKFDIQEQDKHEKSPKTSQLVQNLGVKIMQNINKAVVVNPVSLVALVLLSTPKSALDESHFLGQLELYQRLATLLPYDKDTTITDMPPHQMLDYAIKLKLITKIPHALGDVIGVADKQAPMLSYFRNNILHIFIIASLLSALVQKNGRINSQELYEVARLLYPFLQTELFLKYAHKSIQSVLEETLGVLIEVGLVCDLGEGVMATPDGNSEDYQRLSMLASPAQESLERYFMVLTLLAKEGSGRLTAEQIVELAYLIGGRVSVLYDEDLPDLFDKALFRNFLNALIRMDYISADEQDMLHFDDRIETIASFARLVLSPDTLTLVNEATKLSMEEIETITKPTQKRFLTLS